MNLCRRFEALHTQIVDFRISTAQTSAADAREDVRELKATVATLNGNVETALAMVREASKEAAAARELHKASIAASEQALAEAKTAAREDGVRLVTEVHEMYKAQVCDRLDASLYVYAQPQ